MSKKVMTTMHVSESVRARFKELASAQKRDMSPVVEELMIRWIDEHSSGPRTDRVQMDHATSLLTKAVCEQLDQNRQWARDVLMGLGLGLPGSNVFASRLLHFLDEKQELGKRFARWVLQRSRKHVANGRTVVLVCDSGTTVFWFLKAFGEALNHDFKVGGSNLMPNELSIVTNNIPGAEAFVTASLHTAAIDAARVRISDVIDCRILAGTFLPEYAAITGRDTELDLDSYAKKVRAEAKRKNRQSSPVFIAITTGNWITLQGPEGAGAPCLLARGRGHGPFKEKLLEICDEGFALAPLGKILIDTSVDELNRRLNYSASAPNPQERSYVAVSTPAKRSKMLRVVSTTRQKQNVLRDHSALLCRKLGHYGILEDCSDPKPTTQATSPIGDVHHLLFPFDQFAEESIDTQIEIEFPHKQTREESFMRDVFNFRKV